LNDCRRLRSWFRNHSHPKSRILTDLGFVCHHLPPDRYSVQPPYWRPDVLIADDLVEDIARIPRRRVKGASRWLREAMDSGLTPTRWAIDQSVSPAATV